MTEPASDRVVEIFTDGACKGNPGPGGWGAVSALGLGLAAVALIAWGAEHRARAGASREARRSETIA